MPTFSFPVQIPDFYAKYWSLYAKVSVLLSKWPTFYSKFLVWPHTREHRPVWPSWGGRGVVLHARSALHEYSGRGGFEWVSLRRCEWNDIGARYLLRQTQSQTWPPVWISGPQGTWHPSSAEHPGLRSCNSDCNPAVKPTFHFLIHELNQRGE